MEISPPTRFGYLFFIGFLVLGQACGQEAPLPNTETEPSGATNPTEPTVDDATDPTDETETGEPTDPATDDASDPIDETEDDDPTEPTTGDATDPADESDPADPPQGSGNTVNFSVNMNCSELDNFSTVYVTGPFSNWCGNCNPLFDDDGDGIYTGSYTFESAAEVEYKYNVDNWASQEDLVDDMNNGGNCAPVTDYANYANRRVTLSSSSAVSVNDAYGTCELCEDVSGGTPMLTFQVNMGTSYSGGVTVGNSVQGWNTAGMVQLNDSDGDGIYVGSMEVEAGTTIEYKFIQGYNGGGNWEEVPVECAIVTGIYANRVFTMPNNDHTLPVVAFGSCADDPSNDNGPGTTPNDQCSTLPGRPTPVTISGRQIRVGSTAIHMKGVAWAPTPRGQTPGNFFADAVEQDAELMADAGINVVRTYGAIVDEDVLDELHSRGIYVMMNVYYGYSQTIEGTIEQVCALKHHPAILGWEVGNEWNYTNLAQDISFLDAVAKVGTLIDVIKLNDPSRPASTVYGAMPPVSVMSSLSNVDIWGINHYPGLAFGNFFNEWESLTDKPFYFAEYGSDAYNGNIGAEDEASQATILSNLTEEIHENASVNYSGVCAGGMVFEFNDEWWKYNGGSPWTHDTSASWQNYGYPDPDMHEEWWGLVNINREPRQAYYTYRDLIPPQ